MSSRLNHRSAAAKAAKTPAPTPATFWGPAFAVAEEDAEPEVDEADEVLPVVAAVVEALEDDPVEVLEPVAVPEVEALVVLADSPVVVVAATDAEELTADVVAAVAAVDAAVEQTTLSGRSLTPFVSQIL